MLYRAQERRKNLSPSDDHEVLVAMSHNLGAIKSVRLCHTGTQLIIGKKLR